MTEAIIYYTKHKSGHIEVHDAEGNFLLSADTEREAWQEIHKLANTAPVQVCAG